MKLGSFFNMINLKNFLWFNLFRCVLSTWFFGFNIISILITFFYFLRWFRLLLFTLLWLLFFFIWYEFSCSFTYLFYLFTRCFGSFLCWNCFSWNLFDFAPSFFPWAFLFFAFFTFCKLKRSNIYGLRRICIIHVSFFERFICMQIARDYSE